MKKFDEVKKGRSMDFPYDDIIDLPHPTSKKHPRMSMTDRAAQFSPFAALSGFSWVIQEAGRLTDTRVELGASDQADLERTLNVLDSQEEEHPQIQVTYFLPDTRKEGGAYVTITGRLKRIDQVKGVLVLQEGVNVPIHDIRTVEIAGLSRE